MYGQALCHEMKRMFDFAPILKTAVEDCGVRDETAARELLDAFLQWFSLLPTVRPGSAYVMLKTDIDAVFHAFVLNTAAYREFCMRFVGHFIDHHPIDEELKPYVDKGVGTTIAMLEEHFGDALHPALREWRHQVDTGAYAVSCGWLGTYCGRSTAMAEDALGRMSNGVLIMH